MNVSERIALAQRTTEADVIARLVADSSSAVRRALAARMDLLAEHLAMLANDRDKQVRRAVAEHPNADDPVLTALIEDLDFHVHWHAARNRSGSPAFRMLAPTSTHRDVRWALAQLRPLELEVAMALSKDPARQVREELALGTTHAEVLEVLIGDPDPRVRGTVAFNSNATAQHLSALLHDRNAPARVGLASSPLAPLSMLMELVNDRSLEVRFALTMHKPHPELLRTLLNDPDELVSGTAANSLRDSAP